MEHLIEGLFRLLGENSITLGGLSANGFVALLIGVTVGVVIFTGRRR
jgi:hypothetical protein